MGGITDFFVSIGTVVIVGVIINEVIKSEEELQAQKALDAQKQLEENQKRVKIIPNPVNYQPAKSYDYYSEPKAMGICCNTGCNNLATRHNGQCDDHYFDDDDDD